MSLTLNAAHASRNSRRQLRITMKHFGPRSAMGKLAIEPIVIPWHLWNFSAYFGILTVVGAVGVCFLQRSGQVMLGLEVIL
jgi:hypothetical protein